MEIRKGDKRILKTSYTMSDNAFNGKTFQWQNEFGDKNKIFCFHYIKETARYEIGVTEDVDNSYIYFALNKEELDKLINMLTSLRDYKFEDEAVSECSGV